MWLVLMDKLLMQNNMYRKIWKGTKRCSHEKMDEETITHLFVKYTLSTQVCQEVGITIVLGILSKEIQLNMFEVLL